MASIFSARSIVGQQSENFAQKISSHVAASLVVFALLQIAIVAKLGGSLPMHFGIFLAIGGFSIAARNLEQKWTNTPYPAARSDGLRLEFRDDLVTLWVASLIAPFLWLPVSILSSAIFS